MHTQSDQGWKNFFALLYCFKLHPTCTHLLQIFRAGRNLGVYLSSSLCRRNYGSKSSNLQWYLGGLLIQAETQVFLLLTHMHPKPLLHFEEANMLVDSLLLLYYFYLSAWLFTQSDSTPPVTRADSFLWGLWWGHGNSPSLPSCQAELLERETGLHWTLLPQHLPLDQALLSV